MTTTPEQVDFAYRVYGDNILECLILIEWLDHTSESGFIKIGEAGSLDRAVYIYRANDNTHTYAFQVCPYYGGTGNQSLWPHDPLGEWSSEKPDVVVTRVLEDGTETGPIFAIEFCDALQAGNQAWQRFRRAYDAALAGIPYFYVLPLIGWERDSGGLSLKGARYQSAQITLAQLTLCSKFGVPSLQFYTKTGWIELAEHLDLPLPERWEEFTDIRLAVRFAGSLLRRERSDRALQFAEQQEALVPVFKGMFQVAKRYGSYQNTKFTLHTERPAFQSDDDLENAATSYAAAVAAGKPVEDIYSLHDIKGGDLHNRGALFYKDAQTRTTSQRFRDEVLAWLNWRDTYSPASRWAYLERWGVDLSEEAGPILLRPGLLNRLARENRDKLPVTYKEGKAEAVFVQKRGVLREILSAAYPLLSQEFLDWVDGKEDETRPLLTVPFYGYKPSGDSRPDRGLLPNLAALFPDLTANRNILVIMYSIHTPASWKQLLIQENNELWNVIRALAGGLIVDVTGEGVLLSDEGADL